MFQQASCKLLPSSANADDEFTRREAVGVERLGEFYALTPDLSILIHAFRASYSIDNEHILP